MVPGRRIRVFVGGVAVSVVSIIAAWTLLHNTTPEVAYLWVDADGGACVRQDPPGAYDDEDACTPDAAFQAALPGDSAVVKGEEYGNQKITQRAEPMTAPGMVFYMEPGAHFGTLNFGCENQSNGCLPVRMDAVDWITMVGAKGTWDAEFLYFANSTHITIDGITVDKDWAVGKAVFFAGSTDYTMIRNANICCNLNSPLMESFMATDDYGPNAHVTFERTSIHSMRRTNLGVHNECLLAPAMPYLTLLWTHWYGCNVMNFNVGAFGASAAISQVGFHWANNIFESPTNQTESDKTFFPWYQGCNTPDYDEAEGWVIEYNLMESLWYDCGGLNGAVIRGNIGVMGDHCPPGATFEHNMFNISCGPTDTAVADIMTNGAAYFGGISTHEWWLRAGSPAIDAGGGDCPETDIVGNPRPVGAACDAGPNERP